MGTDPNADKLLFPNIISIHRTQNQHEVVEIYSAADVFVNPTREDTYLTVNMGPSPAEVFAEAIELEFEGKEFLAPVGYDAFLTSLYGDYLPEPPVEKRKTHHSFKAYRL